jgi:hypothetical protein
MLLQDIRFLLHCGPKATLLFLNYIMEGTGMPNGRKRHRQKIKTHKRKKHRKKMRALLRRQGRL